MATRYYSFNIFMDDVIKRANQRVNLEELFAVKNGDVIGIISTLISKGGWEVFIAVVAFLLLGPVGFALAMGGLLSNPLGWILTTILGVAAIVSIRVLYQNKELPIAVKEVGEEFKPRWSKVEGNQTQIDILVEEAANRLIDKASAAQKRLFNL